MMFLRILLKVAVIPLIVIMLLLKWIVLFFDSMTEWIFRILSLLIFLTAVVTFLMKLSDRKEAVGMLIGAFVVFVLPFGCAACAALLSCLQTSLGDFLRS